MNFVFLLRCNYAFKVVVLYSPLCGYRKVSRNALICSTVNASLW